MIDEGQGHRRSKANIAICLYFIIFATGPFRSNTKFMGPNNMERKIILIPLGAIEGRVLDALEEDLAAKSNRKEDGNLRER
jgi:hypothetical protein